jgi:excisionase family DNA binding protein
MTASSPWLTTDEAAAYAKVAKITILRACRSEALRSTLVGRHRRLHISWIDSWLGFKDTQHWPAGIVQKDAP